MARVRCSLRVLICASVVALIWASIGEVSAATKKRKEPTPVVAVVKPSKQQSVLGHTPSVQHAKKSSLRATVRERRSEARLNQAKPMTAKLKRKSLKIPRQKKGQPEATPEAVVPLKSGLTPHGMLETPQRYDPRRDHRGSGIPDPQTPELTHDHFQELDRNQDGKVDPVERAFGRPDMDRDLHSHGSR